MGSQISHIKKKRKIKMVVLGLDSAGKTTLVYYLKTGKNRSTIPTIGFNTEQIKFKKHQIILWDVGGQDKVREHWKHYFTNINILAYVVDSTDNERLEETSNMLHKVLSMTPIKNCVILVYANKQDVAGASNSGYIAERLGLNNNISQKWHVQPASAINGEGIHEGLDWAVNALEERNQVQTA